MNDPHSSHLIRCCCVTAPQSRQVNCRVDGNSLTIVLLLFVLLRVNSYHDIVRFRVDSDAARVSVHERPSDSVPPDIRISRSEVSDNYTETKSEK